MSAQPTLKLDSKGVSVKLLQRQLNAKGFHLVVDGQFGVGTEQAVEQFQASQGLTVDGVVGSVTWNLLMSLGTEDPHLDVLVEQQQVLLKLIPKGNPKKIVDVLTVAIAKLGAKEIPEGSNGGPELIEIVGGTGKPPSAYYQHWKITDAKILKTLPAWCCLFVCYALRVGLAAKDWSKIPFGNWLGGCAQVEEWAVKQNRWKLCGEDLIPSGALFTISRGESGSDASASTKAGHIGFVIVDHGDGTVTTIEGNVSNKVGSHKRKKADLRGYAVWN